MPKTSLAVGILALLLAARAGAAESPPPDLRPLLVIQSSTASTDSLDYTDQRITIYQGGTLTLQDLISLDPRSLSGCDVRVLALGTGSPAALAKLQQALRNGQVGIQRDCGLGQDSGVNLDYRLEWTSPRGRTNRFKFGTFYQNGCPAGLALVKKAVEDYVEAVVNAPGTKVVRSGLCARSLTSAAGGAR
jgi:hypothetical protein